MGCNITEIYLHKLIDMNIVHWFVWLYIFVMCSNLGLTCLENLMEGMIQECGNIYGMCFYFDWASEWNCLTLQVRHLCSIACVDDGLDLIPLELCENHDVKRSCRLKELMVLFFNCQLLWCNFFLLKSSKQQEMWNLIKIPGIIEKVSFDEWLEKVRGTRLKMIFIFKMNNRKT